MWGSPPPAAKAPFGAQQARAHQEAWAKHLGVPVEYENTIGMKFVLIPPGEFLMGSTAAEIEATLAVFGGDENGKSYIKSEAPQHKVILTKPVYLGIHEVTQADYEKVMGQNPSHFAPLGTGKEAVAGMDTTRHPVEMVTWNDAAEFCTKLSEREKRKPFQSELRAGEPVPIKGTGYRLPTEAEWEFACRAGTTTKYWIGDKDEDLVRAGWFSANSLRMNSVGELKANPFGLFDMHGNVWEWVQDVWGLTYFEQFQGQPALDPSGASSAGSERVLRGGGLDAQAFRCHASSRFAYGPTAKGYSMGFRVSLPVDSVRPALKGTGMPKPGATNPDRRAAEYVLSIGGIIRIKENGETREIKAVGELPQGAFELTYLWSVSPKTSDAGLANFKGCKNLTELYLTSPQVGDAGLVHFKDCKDLAGLNLSGTQVSDEGLATFKDCKGLMILALHTTQVSDAGLAHFQGCKKLGHLDLNGTQVSDAGLAHFKESKELQILFLNNTQVTDAGLAHFKDCHDMRSVVLRGTKVSNAGLEYFKDCKHLEGFDLNETQVSDAGLEQLAHYPALGRLFVQKTKVTEAGVKKLSAALPLCKIDWDGGVIEP